MMSNLHITRVSLLLNWMGSPIYKSITIAAYNTSLRPILFLEASRHICLGHLRFPTWWIVYSLIIDYCSLTLPIILSVRYLNLIRSSALVRTSANRFLDGIHWYSVTNIFIIRVISCTKFLNHCIFLITSAIVSASHVDLANIGLLLWVFINYDEK